MASSASLGGSSPSAALPGCTRHQGLLQGGCSGGAAPGDASPGTMHGSPQLCWGHRSCSGSVAMPSPLQGQAQGAGLKWAVCAGTSQGLFQSSQTRALRMPPR